MTDSENFYKMATNRELARIRDELLRMLVIAGCAERQETQAKLNQVVAEQKNRKRTQAPQAKLNLEEG